MENQTRPAVQDSIIPTCGSTDRHQVCSFRTGSGSVFSTSLSSCLGLISWYSRGLPGFHSRPQNLRVKLRPAAEAPWFLVAVAQSRTAPAFLRGTSGWCQPSLCCLLLAGHTGTSGSQWAGVGASHGNIQLEAVFQVDPAPWEAGHRWKSRSEWRMSQGCLVEVILWTAGRSFCSQPRLSYWGSSGS